MAISMFMDWEGLTSDDYDRIREIVDWEGDVPDGAQFHAAAFDEEGAHIFDVWDDADSFQTFVNERIIPAVRETGIESEPDVRIHETHAIFTPGVQQI